MWVKLFSWLWLLLFVVVGILAIYTTPEQIVKGNLFTENEIKPAVDYIDSFQRSEYRLPSPSEFNRWQYTSQYNLHNNNSTHSFHEDSLRTLIDSADLMTVEYFRNGKNIPGDLKPYPSDIDWNKNYVLSVWNGEWFEYYASWNHVYVTNRVSWGSTIWGVVEMLFVGLLPFIIPFSRKKIKSVKLNLSVKQFRFIEIILFILAAVSVFCCLIFIL